MERSKQTDILSSCLPELMPDELFSHPFYAKVARAYWVDQGLVSLEDAIIPTVDQMKTSELLNLADLIVEKGFQPESIFGVYAKVWEYNRPDKVVDEEGLVHSHQVLGSISRVREFLVDNPEVVEILADKLKYELFDAADKLDGQGSGIRLINEHLVPEMERRKCLKKATVDLDDNFGCD